MKAIIPAARDKKTRPFWRNKNKHLLPLGNTPMILYALSALLRAGIRDIGIVVAPDDQELQKVLGDGSAYDTTFTYIVQEEPRGIAHAVMQSRDFLGDEPFMVHLGDNIARHDLSRLLERFSESGAAGLLALAKVQNPQRFGVPVFENDKIVEVEEHPFKPQSPYAVAGVYVYSPVVHEFLPRLRPSARGDYEISDLHTELIKEGHGVEWLELDDWWKDAGEPDDLIAGNRFVLEGLRSNNQGHVQEGVELHGPVKIGEGSKLLGRTKVLGPAVIGKDCLITDSYIGPYTSLGNNVELHSAEVENSILFDNVRVASPKRMQSSIIGEGSVIASEQHTKPSGHRLVIGENAVVDL